jgi:hypothetical protein
VRLFVAATCLQSAHRLQSFSEHYTLSEATRVSSAVGGILILQFFPALLRAVHRPPDLPDYCSSDTNAKFKA